MIMTISQSSQFTFAMSQNVLKVVSNDKYTYEVRSLHSLLHALPCKYVALRMLLLVMRQETYSPYNTASSILSIFFIISYGQSLWENRQPLSSLEFTLKQDY